MKTNPFWTLVCVSVLLFSNCKQAVVEVPLDLSWVERLDTSISIESKIKIKSWVLVDSLDNTKLENAFKLYTPHKDLFTAMNTAKSIYHQRVLIDDNVASIPGISLGAFAANGLSRTLIPANPVNTNLDLPAAEAPNFTAAVDITLSEGTKIYRVIGGAGSFPTGGYWTETKPVNYAEIIGGTAVQPEWNGFNEIVEFTVPAGGMKVWKGKAAAQNIASIPNKFIDVYKLKYNLSGTGNQLFIPNIYRDFRDTAAYNKFLRNITKKETITWKKK